MERTDGSYIVSWDFAPGEDVGVLVVGRQENGKMHIVNAFQGEEAYEIYEKLSTVKGTDAE
jgi:hypothetical protein